MIRFKSCTSTRILNYEDNFLLFETKKGGAWLKETYENLKLDFK